MSCSHVCLWFLLLLFFLRLFGIHSFIYWSVYIDIFKSTVLQAFSGIFSSCVSCPVKFIHASVSPFNHGSHFLFYFDSFVSSALCPILLPPSCLIVRDYCHLRVLLCSLLLTGLMCIKGAISVSVLVSASFNVFCMSHSVLIFFFFILSVDFIS